MTSLILRTASRFLITLLLLYSLFLLLRGHNAPGGGFVGGLAASAWALYAIAYGERLVRKSLRLEPQSYIVIGLSLAVLSGTPALFRGQEFLSAQWLILNLERGHKLELGSPLVFDIGVYLVVLGTALTIILVLEEEDR